MSQTKAIEERRYLCRAFLDIYSISLSIVTAKRYIGVTYGVSASRWVMSYMRDFPELQEEFRQITRSIVRGTQSR